MTKIAVRGPVRNLKSLFKWLLSILIVYIRITLYDVFFMLVSYSFLINLPRDKRIFTNVKIDTTTYHRWYVTVVAGG